MHVQIFMEMSDDRTRIFLFIFMNICPDLMCKFYAHIVYAHVPIYVYVYTDIYIQKSNRQTWRPKCTSTSSLVSKKYIYIYLYIHVYTYT